MSRLYGVPNSVRAAKQILSIEKGDFLLFYTVGTKEIHGLYRAVGKAFMEARPERGPWKGRPIDALRAYYPYRIEIEAVEAFSNPLRTVELRRKGLGLNENVIRRGSSVVYLDDVDTQKLVKLLERANRNSLRLDLGVPGRIRTFA